MKLTYHAWIGETIGLDSEDFGEPAKTLDDLLHMLQGQSHEKAQIFARLDRIYIAVNNQLVPKHRLDLALSGSDCVSFFPAISGG